MKSGLLVGEPVAGGGVPGKQPPSCTALLLVPQMGAMVGLLSAPGPSRGQPGGSVCSAK